jgi:hypothetical protein
MDAAARGGSACGRLTRRTGRSRRAGRALLALRPRRPGRTSIALGTFRRLPARAQSEGQGADNNPAADSHELSQASRPCRAQYGKPDGTVQAALP